MSAAATAGLAARLFVALQHLLPQHALARLVYRATRSRRVPLKNALIRGFVDRFHPDLSEAEEPEALKYASFNAFFTRALRAGARRIDPDPALLVSPVDGTVSQIGLLDGPWLLQAKGRRYTLESLLATELTWPEQFRGGAFVTLYLAPRDYHRIHMPLAGTLRAAWYVPGALFSVNAATAAAVSGLFARNERVACVFAQGALSFALVLIGALFVGSMATVWHGEVTPRAVRQRAELPLTAGRAPLQLEKGVELGRFNMGSTVILLLPPGRSAWLPGLAAGSRVRLGQPLARLT